MREGREERKPHGAIPVVTDAAGGSTEGVQVTWYGHSSALVEIDGDRVLFDPVWSERCSPVPSRRPAAAAPATGAGRDCCRRVDAIVISHDHYDHLDLPTIRALARAPRTRRSSCRSASGAHLSAWGDAVDAGRRARLGRVVPRSPA